MSEIEKFDPEGKCSQCMGSGHFVKSVFNTDGTKSYVLIFHCPLCNGTGIKPVIEKMMEEDVLREQGLIA